MTNKKILALVDYKNRFGSKHFDKPYRSGLDKKLLYELFKKYSFNLEYHYFHEINFEKKLYKGVPVIYTSSEDIGYYYKSFIEDIVLACENNGATVIPPYKFLRANNNKVFMELLRKQSGLEAIKNLRSGMYGTLEEAKNDDYLKKGEYPKVLKLAEGASGRNVFLVKSFQDLIKKIKKLSRTRNLYQDLWDWGRSIKHKGYIKESLYRQKFIVQDFIPNLKNDWKIYVFGKKYYIFKRPILPGRGIKASGGGYNNYFYDKNANPPDGIFDFAKDIYDNFNVPHFSLDIAFDGKIFYLIEFQGLYFGTAGIPYSRGYFIKENNKWSFIEKKLLIEQVYCDSIVEYLEK